MGRLFKSTNEMIEEPKQVYAGLSYGPLTTQASPDRITASNADGSIVVEVMTDAAYQSTSEVVRQLAAGIDVHLNGEPVARLVQQRSGMGRAKRAIRLEWVDSDRWPQGAYFRARGLSGASVLETDEGRLIASGLREPSVHDDRVTPELVVLFAAVFFSPLSRCTRSGS